MSETPVEELHNFRKEEKEDRESKEWSRMTAFSNLASGQQRKSERKNDNGEREQRLRIAVCQSEPVIWCEDV